MYMHPHTLMHASSVRSIYGSQSQREIVVFGRASGDQFNIKRESFLVLMPNSIFCVPAGQSCPGAREYVTQSAYHNIRLYDAHGPQTTQHMCRCALHYIYVDLSWTPQPRKAGPA